MYEVYDVLFAASTQKAYSIGLVSVGLSVECPVV